MIKVVAFQNEHLDSLKLKDCHDGEVIGKVSTSAFTLLSGDTPIAILGWYFLTPKVIQTWALLSIEIHQNRFSFHRTVKELVEYGFEKTQAQRIQLSVKCGYIEGWKWAKSLGFSCEGVMKHYGPNKEDYWLFARVA